MKFINAHNIPSLLFSQLTWVRPRTYDISVTELLKSPRQRQLSRRHDAEIEIDASANLWAFLGTACHLVLEKAAKGVDGLTEERLIVDVDGWKVGGQPDLYYREGDSYKLIDLKTTSVYSFLLKNGGARDDWEKQLNIYAWMLQSHGFHVDYAEIWAVLRDWQRSKVEREPEYPPIPFHVMKVDLWPPEHQRDFLAERVRLHRKAETVPEDDLPMCSPEERWRRPASWAVMKGSQARALRVFDTSEEAVAFDRSKRITDRPTTDVTRVVERPGADIKCNPEFCHGAPWCHRYQQLLNPNEL